MVDFAAFAKRLEREAQAARVRAPEHRYRVRCKMCREETPVSAPLPAWPDTHCATCGGVLYTVDY